MFPVHLSLIAYLVKRTRLDETKIQRMSRKMLAEAWSEEWKSYVNEWRRRRWRWMHCERKEIKLGPDECALLCLLTSERRRPRNFYIRHDQSCLATCLHLDVRNCRRDTNAHNQDKDEEKEKKKSKTEMKRSILRKWYLACSSRTQQDSKCQNHLYICCASVIIAPKIRFYSFLEVCLSLYLARSHEDWIVFGFDSVFFLFVLCGRGHVTCMRCHYIFYFCSILLWSRRRWL